MCIGCYCDIIIYIYIYIYAQRPVGPRPPPPPMVWYPPWLKNTKKNYGKWILRSQAGKHKKNK